MPTLQQGMADGRTFTTYVSSAVMNATLMKKLGARNETEYRHLLQANPDVAKPRVSLPPKPRM